jgi:predicted RNA-binding protein with PUA-like domain
MAMWLLKTEPSDYTFERLVADKKTVWDGVTSPAGLKNIRSAKKGDRALIYHTGDVRAAVGLAKIVSDPYPDPKEEDPKFVVFDVAPERLLKKPVTLAQVKAIPSFAQFGLVREGRLSVVPVSEAYWKELMALAGEK